MKKVMVVLLAAGLLAVACDNPAGPSTDSGTFELNLFYATEREKSMGEGYNFETGEKVAITSNMAADPVRMGTYGDLDAFPYTIWARERFIGNASWYPVGENESLEGVWLKSQAGREYRISVRNEVVARTRKGVESKYVVTYRAIDT